jgi:hypothetical protein
LQNNNVQLKQKRKKLLLNDKPMMEALSKAEKEQ